MGVTCAIYEYLLEIQMCVMIGIRNFDMRVRHSMRDEYVFNICTTSFGRIMRVCAKV